MTDAGEEPTNEERGRRGTAGKFVEGIGAFLRNLRQPSSARQEKEQQAWNLAVRGRFEAVHRQAEGMNMTAMTILDMASGIPNQASTNVLSGYEFRDESGKVDQRWALLLSFGANVPGRASDLQTPLLVEGRKPRFVLDGMTTEADTATIAISAAKNPDGTYAAPRTQIALNGSTRESDGREFGDGTLDDTPNPTGSIVVDIDNNGQITELLVGRNDKTGLSPEPVSPDIVDGLPDMLQQILKSVTSTSEAYLHLQDDLEQ